MVILKGYKFRLKSSKKVNNKLSKFAGCCRFVWNHFLYQRIEKYEKEKSSLSYTEQANMLPALKREIEWLREPPAQALQQTLKDLERAYKNFFKRVKNGENPGFPRFKKKGKNDGFRYPQGFKITGNKIFLPKIGWVRFFKSREIEGRPKNVTVSRKGKHWFVSIQVEITIPDPEHPSDSIVGIDMGIHNFATLSNGTVYAPLNGFKKLQEKLRKEQKKLSRKVKFSNNWKKQKEKVTKVHIKIADVRRDFLHKVSTAISKNHAVVVLEDLKVSNMSKSAKGTIENPGKNVKAKSGLNKSILDQGWFEFRRMLEYKLNWMGGNLVTVDPKHTSQTCPECGHVSSNNRKTQSKFLCEVCGYEENADYVGALNILAGGQPVSACGVDALAATTKQGSPFLQGGEDVKGINNKHSLIIVYVTKGLKERVKKLAKANGTTENERGRRECHGYK